MTTPSVDKARVTVSLAQAEAVAKAFGKAFTGFAVEILKLASEPDSEAGETGGAEIGHAQGEEGAASSLTPARIAEAYERTKASAEAVVVEPAEIWERLIRSRLLVALKRQNMSQATLAKRLGKSDSQISRILAKPESRQVNTLKEIADALSVDLADVLRGLDPVPKGE